jgi:hypothetical protein
MIDNRSFQLIAATLPKFTDEKNYLNQSVNILGEILGFDVVNLFLVDEQKQNAVFAAGYGKFAKSFLAHGHKLSLTKNGLVADVVNFGEIHFEKPVHPMPFYLGHERRKCQPPFNIEIDVLLEFQTIRESKIVDWRTQSAVSPPIGWEICLPMQFNNMTFGAIDFLLQLNLSDDEKQFWAASLLTDREKDIKFSESVLSGLQWLVNLISSNYQKAKAL